MILRLARDWVWLQRSQWLRKDQIAEMQARKLREMVSHAYQKVPFYHRLYDAAGVDPSSITDTMSIHRLPITTKQHFGDIPLEERTAMDTDLSACIPSITSGSTGMPITVLRDPRALSYQIALRLRRYWAWGIKPSDKICVTNPGPGVGILYLYSKGLLGFFLKRKIRSLSLAADMDDHVSLISKWRPDVLEAPPSYFKALITFCEEGEISIALKVAVAVGEVLDDSTRELISDSLHAEVFDGYGLAEVGGVAWECPTHSGCHINTDLLVVEFLRDEEAVTAGEPGELCITNLYRKATPVIRYLVGDIATPLDDDCPCGRGLTLMKGIQGRIVDFILTRDGRYISPHRVMYALERVPGVAKYKVIQKSDRSIELLVKSKEMKVEPFLQVLRERCRQLFADTPVSIKLVDEIESSKGWKSEVIESRLSR